MILEKCSGLRSRLHQELCARCGMNGQVAASWLHPVVHVGATVAAVRKPLLLLLQPSGATRQALEQQLQDQAARRAAELQEKVATRAQVDKQTHLDR